MKNKNSIILLIAIMSLSSCAGYKCAAYDYTDHKPPAQACKKVKKDYSRSMKKEPVLYDVFGIKYR